MEQSADDKVNRTALYASHVALGAKIIDFAGWQMPLYYEGILSEHHTVRQKVGLFDVSHMGRITIKGKKACSFLNYLATNQIPEKQEHIATYTTLCNSDGGCVDDLLIYRQEQDHFFVIVNASNRNKDLEHFKKIGIPFDVSIEEHFSDEGILAIQGPLAIKVIEAIFPEALRLKPMHFAFTTFRNQTVILSRSGYTGAGGFELYVPKAILVNLWQYLLEQGSPYGIKPVGLGARDTLRLEMGYALYGHELSEQIAPIESIAAWTVKMEKGDFLGKEALLALSKSGKKRYQYGIVLKQEGVGRSGYSVFKSAIPIGKITSGSFSPTLNQSIAIVLVNQKLNIGDTVEVEIRKKSILAEVVKIPFVTSQESI